MGKSAARLLRIAEVEGRGTPCSSNRKNPGTPAAGGDLVWESHREGKVTIREGKAVWKTYIKAGMSWDSHLRDQQCLT